ncbi:MAG: putative lipase [Bacteroidetes bacterium]|nr:MAG: putative lipase [Bacteroidota bacterium]
MIIFNNLVLLNYSHFPPPNTYVMSNRRTTRFSLLFCACLFLIVNCGKKIHPPQVLKAYPYGNDATMLSFSFLANINTYLQSSPAGLKQHAVTAVGNVLQNPNVRGMIGDWRVLWGPVSYTVDTSQIDSCVSDNLMLLLRGPDPANPANSILVLAIAGTNGISAYDWVSEDFAADTMALWPAARPSGSPCNMSYFSNPVLQTNPVITDTGRYISLGTANGLDILFNKMKDDSKGSITDFLKIYLGNQTGTIPFYVTGHSLGGALSPCVALSLSDNQSCWDPGRKTTVKCYSFAGPSPGNQKFAQYFLARFDTDKFKGIYNSLDVVPHAYQSSMMDDIPTLYQSLYYKLDKPCFLQKLFACIDGEISGFNYTTLYQPAATFTGTTTFKVDSMYKANYDSMYNAPDFPLESKYNAYKAQLWHYSCAGGAILPPTDAEAAPFYANTMCFGNLMSEQHVDGYVTQYKIQRVYGVIMSNHAPSKIPNADALIWKLLCAPLVKNCLLSSWGCY